MSVVVVVVLVVLLVAAVLLAASRVRRVPAGHVGVVLRAGAYARLVTPGILWLAGGEEVRSVPTTEQQLSTQVPLGGRGADRLSADLRIAYRVTDPVRLLSAVDDAAYALERTAADALRDFTAGVDAAALSSSNVRAAEAVCGAARPRAHGWGLELLRVEVVVHEAGDGS